jgi:transposase
MEVVHERCAGLDVHKASVVACRVGDSSEVKSFGTTTEALLALADWLRAGGVSHVAMESTGVYWRPIYNVLEGDFEVLVVNAQHIKHVPGRKTDVNDAQWIAQLLRHGLLRASFVPDMPQRALRELVRYRTHLVEERVRESNRLYKVLEDANIKLSSVASDVLGASGREMLSAIIAGQDDPAALAQLAKASLRKKIDDLEKALTGRVADHHRLMLRMLLDHIDDLNRRVLELEGAINHYIVPFDQADLLQRLDDIPGVDSTLARVIVSEIGVDMSVFPTAHHLASWAGVAPRKQQSGPKKFAAKLPPANRYLRPALVQAAHAAGRTKTYLGEQYHRIRRRRGAKKAAIAVAHSILVIVYHMIARQTPYFERGADFFDNLHPSDTKKWLIRRFQKLGYNVILEPISPVL